jgi:hypothetical protein
MLVFPKFWLHTISPWLVVILGLACLSEFPLELVLFLYTHTRRGRTEGIVLSLRPAKLSQVDHFLAALSFAKPCTAIHCYGIPGVLIDNCLGVCYHLTVSSSLTCHNLTLLWSTTSLEMIYGHRRLSISTSDLPQGEAAIHAEDTHDHR